MHYLHLFNWTLITIQIVMAFAAKPRTSLKENIVKHGVSTFSNIGQGKNPRNIDIRIDVIENNLNRLSN